MRTAWAWLWGMVWMVGCSSVDDDIAVVAQELRSCNGLPPSALFGAQPTLRCLASGPLTSDRILACGDGAAAERLAVTYAARCALPAGQSVTLDDGSEAAGAL